MQKGTFETLRDPIHLQLVLNSMLVDGILALEANQSLIFIPRLGFISWVNYITRGW